MSNPTGKNQYTGRGGGTKGKASKGSLTSQAKTMSQKIQATPGFSFHGGANAASHEAFIRQGLAKKAAAAKARKRRR